VRFCFQFCQLGLFSFCCLFFSFLSSINHSSFLFFFLSNNAVLTFNAFFSLASTHFNNGFSFKYFNLCTLAADFFRLCGKFQPFYRHSLVLKNLFIQLTCSFFGRIQVGFFLSFPYVLLVSYPFVPEPI